MLTWEMRKFIQLHVGVGGRKENNDNNQLIVSPKIFFLSKLE